MRRTVRFVLLALLALLAPVLLGAMINRVDAVEHWSRTRWGSAGLLPPAAEHADALVQVYAARSWGWKGAFAVHSWIVFKPEGAADYARYDVAGWGVGRGALAVRRNMRPPDGYWAGSPPQLVAELKGAAAAAAIPAIERAIADYPYWDSYRTWPGPNSNTFVAWILRRVPELKAELPPTAIGKDWLPGRLADRTPSGTGYQLSLFGLLGLSVALDEGIEINILGLVVGIDPADIAVKLPGIGRLGLR